MRLLLPLALLAIAVPGAQGADRAAGDQIVFASDRSGAYDLFSVGVDGRGLRRLTKSFPPAAEVALAPRGGRMVFSRPDDAFGPRDLWSARRDGTDLRRLTRRTGQVCDSSPVWSPDVARIAFNRTNCDFGRSALWVMRADGSGARQIAASVGTRFVRSLAWSGDGRTLAVVDGGCGVTLVRPDGSGRRRVLCPLRVGSAAFSPDGRRLAVAVAGARGDELRVGRSDGRAVRRVGSLPAVVAGLVWGRSGRIAFAGRGGIHTIRPDGSGLRRLTRTPAGMYDGSPTWSADGRTLLYSREGELHLVRADGSADELVAPVRHSTDPSWTADGRNVVYVHERPATRVRQVRIANEDGGAVRVLADVREAREPELAPDRRSLVYEADGGSRNLFAIVVVRALPGGLPSSLAESATSPSWAPDGLRLAYAQSSADFSETFIRVARPNGTGRMQLTHEGVATHPAWSRDGRSIAFARAAGRERTDVWTMAADGSDERRVTGDGALPAWAPDGRSLVFRRGDDLVVVDATTGAERALVRGGSLVGGASWRP